MHLAAIIVAILLPIITTPAAAQDEIKIEKVLVIDRVGRYGRSPVFVDPIELLRVTGQWRFPRAGDVVASADGRDVAWREAHAKEDGEISDDALAGGYALATVDVDADRVMILEASGHGIVFVNGEPRVGDPYETAYVRLPVLLKRGANELLFHCQRGRLRAKLTEPPKDVFIDLSDLTLTDQSAPGGLMAGVVVVNATTQPISPIVSGTKGMNRREDRFRIAPLSLRKIPLTRIRTFDDQPKPTVVVIGPEGTLDSAELSPRQREPGQTYKAGFISEIDGSVQYYAVNPATPARDKPRALVLSLHGASVEAINQADAYSSKTWCDIVCPTNRRPFGFDWEDWGRLDALEVLDIATTRFNPHPSQIYLTGHSMGGHGAWIIGSLFPDRFGAVGPSAGWISFSTYASTQPSTQPSSAIVDLMRRCTSPSDPSLVLRNLAQLGVYILHGADDDNVPASEARQMVEHLSKFDKDFIYHEQPKVGHWWESSDEPGAECVDWAAMFDFFARHRLPSSSELRQIDFTTPSPAASSKCHWITIETQQHAMQPSSIQVRVDPGKRRYVGATSNIERLAMDPVHLVGVDPVQIEFDGQKLNDVAWPTDKRLWLARDATGWRVIEKPSPALKGPHRCGPFKDAFRNRMVFVYGTKGTPEENAWALAKARYDAEVWWYRGNGSVDIVPDVEFDPRNEIDRNVILYGNADTISCWGPLLGDSPVQIRRGEVEIGSRTKRSQYLACLFLRPRPRSDRACVAVIGGSGIGGMRLSDRLPIFLSGVGYPDVMIFDPDVLKEGTRAIRCAGFFGNDWSVENGELVWGNE